MGRGKIGWWLRSSRLRSLHSGVYLLGGARPSRHGTWMAATLAYGETAALSHSSAAALWGLRRDHGPTDVTAAQGRQGRPGLRLHRSRLGDEERTVRDAIPVTTVARTLLDLAETVDEDALRGCWEEADRLGILRIAEVGRTCERATGRRGLRALLRLRDGASAVPLTRSELEEEFRLLCLSHELPAPRLNTTVCGFEVDALWPRSRLVVELDGFGFHRHRAAFEKDRARDAMLLAEGYRVLRLTHRRMRDDPDLVAEQVRALLGPEATRQARATRS